jgi:predicted transport protein
LGCSPDEPFHWLHSERPTKLVRYGPAFFLEVLPRKNRITLLLDLDFNEVDDAFEIARDTSQQQFFVNAVYEGRVSVSIRKIDDIEQALPMIRQAWDRA